MKKKEKSIARMFLIKKIKNGIWSSVTEIINY